MSDNNFTLKHATVYQKQNAEEIKISTATKTKSTVTTTTGTKVSKHKTASQQENATTSTKRAEEKPTNAKSNLNTKEFLPATHTNNSSRNSSTNNSPISTTPTKEKTEHIIGGHYTPLAIINKPTTTTTKDNEHEKMDRSRSNKNLAKTSPPTSPTKSLSTTAQSSSSPPIPKQRSLFLTATTTTSHTKEHQQQQEFTTLTTSSSSSSSTVTSAANTKCDDDDGLMLPEVHETETATTRKLSTATKCGTHSLTLRNTMESTTPTGADAIEQHQHTQSHSKYESERTSTVKHSGIITATTTVDSSSSGSGNISASEKSLTFVGSSLQQHNINNSSCNNKISNKLQNNQFIKNQQNTTTSVNSSLTTLSATARYRKNKETCQIPAAAAVVVATGFVSPLSPSKTSANKHKMVAVQEMKKTTQNATHHHQIVATTCGRQSQQQQRQSANKPDQSTDTATTDFDASEDLKYGPGIVSKLRCRYLSLALRESMEKQRHCLENLRRATSLNNLLDRDDHKDDDDDDDDVDDVVNDSVDATQDDIEQENNVDDDTDVVKSARATGGILKRNGNSTNYVNNKKSATFQKNSFNSQSNGTRMSQSQYGASVANGGGASNDAAMRSRHIKRGNDSLKRARSVEALLCEKSPWNFNNRTSLQNSATTPTCVTIEDKIHNARDRLISGSDTMPPKRLTSIIDDTERPPPDLVKQTLKLFEATANRRGRVLNRANSKGEVASKVASYKSIIQEQKPAIVYPKPSGTPTSPTKKLPKPIVKPAVAAAADLLGSPIGRKTSAIAAASPTALQTDAASPIFAASTPKHMPLRATGLSEHTPDIIPRQQQQLLAAKCEATAVVDSPVTALTRKLEKLRIDNTADKQATTTIQTTKTNVTTKESQQVKLQNKHETSAMHAIKDEVNNDDKFVVGGDAAAINFGDAGGDGDNNDKNDRALATQQQQQQQQEIDTKQAGATSTASSDLSDDEYGLGLTKRVTKTALDNIAKAGSTQQFKFAAGHSSSHSNSKRVNTESTTPPHPKTEIPTSVLHAATAAPTKQIGVIRPLPTPPPPPTQHSNNQQHMETLKQQSNNYTQSATSSNYGAYSSSTAGTSLLAHSSHPPLTSREIEKNRINEMKKTALADSTHAAGAVGSTSANAAATTGVNAATTSLDTVINTNSTCKVGMSPNSASSNASGLSELDTAISANNSPLWALRKKRQAPPAAVVADTTMVFNFSNRKEVPDYIENDGVIFRRKFELPKPNESGFVLLGDLSLETSTDTDYDDFSMCPPSPCDVEFENANIVIDGKSSIRQKPKEATFRVQFNDTLTSTFEYPSEASLIVDDSFNNHYANTDDLLSAYEQLVLEDNTDSSMGHHHHHVAVDEIIQLPTQPASATNTPTKNILGNLPLGSAPLGFYSPVKAPIDNLFQLGVTRAPNGNGHAFTTTTNGNSTHNGIGGGVGGGSIVGITDGLIGGESDEPESLQYLKPANDDLTIAYSEGAQKTDLLY